jgi:hypothetical protein
MGLTIKDFFHKVFLALICTAVLAVASGLVAVALSPVAIMFVELMAH